MSGMRELSVEVYAQLQSRLHRILSMTSEPVLQVQHTKELLDDLHAHARAAMFQAAFVNNLPVDDLIRRTGMQ